MRRENRIVCGSTVVNNDCLLFPRVCKSVGEICVLGALNDEDVLIVCVLSDGGRQRSGPEGFRLWEQEEGVVTFPPALLSEEMDVSGKPVFCTCW